MVVGLAGFGAVVDGHIRPTNPHHPAPGADTARGQPMRIGYFLSSEEVTPPDLVKQAKLAEQASFDALWISDHYHPWNDEQGQSPFVWSVIGALSQVTSLPVTTAVTCPTADPPRCHRAGGGDRRL